LYVTIQDLRRTSKLVAVLQRVAVAANEAATIEDAAASAIDEVCGYTAWPIGHLYVVDEPGHVAPTTVWHVDDPEGSAAFRRVTEATSLFKGEGLPGQVLESGRPVWIEDVTTEENFPRARQAVDIGVRAGFGFPVLVGSEVVAVLEFFTFEPAEPDETLLEVMANVGTQLGRVVERSRGQEALEASEREVRTIINTANDAFISIDVGGRITEWNEQAERHFGWSRDDALGRLLTETIMPSAHKQAHTDGITKFLETGEGPVLGRRVELEAVRRDGQVFPIELTPWAVPDGETFRFHAFIHDITERKAFEEQLEHQSLHDPLTGLPNRALLLDRLRHSIRRAQRSQGRTGVLFIDLDRFKAVNDSLGHEGGDRLLLGVAGRLPGVLRAGDTLARLGGDEFVVLCEELARGDDAVAVAERIVGAFVSPFQIGGTEVQMSASIGVAVAVGADADAEQLLADADLAMYRAKERGRGSHEVFDETMRARLVARLETERALRRGIDEGELVAYYQPVIELGGGAVVGMEALVRWHHPDRGLVPPIEFVGLAEETGLIGRIGEWMLRQACWQARRWRDSYPKDPPIWVAVNLSARELEQPNLVDDIVRLLANYTLEPEALMLEVTESVVMDDVRSVVRRLWELKELGVRLVIDDFGTGYSSLDRLRRMPFETLKIDRSFIADIDTVPGGTSLVAAMIAMSHSLGLGVVAEGVETMEQLNQLRRLGCDHFQGFLVGWPGPASEAHDLLAGSAAIQLPGGDGLSTADIEVEVMRIVSQAFSDRLDVARTTRSLMAELRRLAGLNQPG
ncbi:MAG TPA: EAL domain-containing protein, partial [Acidimicrobiales bacterium]|nr:EAL domain-containing protein [Acidimicrobiales bacterium]